MFSRVINNLNIELKLINNFRKYTIPSYITGIDDHEAPAEPKEKSRNFKRSKRVKEKAKPHDDDDDNRKPIILCKNKEFNFYPGTVYSKFDDIPIASRGWHHNKSKGDFFTIYPLIQENESQGSEVSFEDLGVDPQFIEYLRSEGIHEPTYIQKIGIPEIQAGKNTKISAETGCGKTLTYLLPIVNQIRKWKPLVKDRPYNNPLALVITPNKELTEQIYHEARRLTSGTDIKVKMIVGGRAQKLMFNPSVKDIDILISTVGVLNKLAAVGVYKLDYVRHTVLDEAHALFDETFVESVENILRRISFEDANGVDDFPKNCQMTLASATMPSELPEFIIKNANDEPFMELKSINLHKVLVPQTFYRLGKIHKPLKLLQLIKPRAMRRKPTIIFSNDNATCDWISIFLNKMNVPATSLNGSMSVNIRKDKFQTFRRGNVNILSATNAVSRGLDTVMVDYIINYDFPYDTADYIHRCGRTGRVGGISNGRVVNFITRTLEVELAQKIERATRRDRAIPLFDIKQQKREKAADQKLKMLLNSS